MEAAGNKRKRGNIPKPARPVDKPRPEDRAEWSFGQLLAWHLLEWGTRPGGNPDRHGEKWSTQEFAFAVDTGKSDSDRKVRGWLNGEYRPQNTKRIEQVLFGNVACYDAWRLELRRAHANIVDGPLPDPAPAPPRLPVSNIPIRVPEHFLGREDALAAIEASLARYEGRVAITAVHGLRGVGKTTLAAAYAERHHGDYRATWWIRAHLEPTLRADLAALGIRLGWAGADEKEEPALDRVMGRLRHEGEGILLIYDNAIDAATLNPYLPRGGAAKVLVTSNAHAWRGVAELIEIPLWPKKTGADYFTRRTGREGERAAAEALSGALGGLPLAHEQAAAYCERLDISLTEYAKRFDAAPGRLLDDARHAPAEYHDGLTVAKTFGLAIEEASKLHPAAEPLIIHAALLAPEPIPLYFFAEAREKFAEPLASALEGDGLDEAVAALRTFALVDRETITDEREPEIKTDCIRLHRLVRQVAAARLDGGARVEALVTLSAAIAAACPEEVFREANTWPRARRLMAHSLEIYERVLGPAHPDTANCLNNLASLRQDQGDYAGARPLFERALEIHETVLGPAHPLTAMSLNNLASLLSAEGDDAGARLLFERALAIDEKALGLDHPDTATTLNNLGTLLADKGDRAAARPLLEQSLAIRQKALGPEHPSTATSLSSLALLLSADGDYAEARPLFEQSLEIHEKALGPEHPSTATSLNNLAFLLKEQGDYAAARPLYERALANCEKALGHDHPDTALSLNNLANLLKEQGAYAEARSLHERALAINEKVLGPAHPDTALSLNNLAALLADAGNCDAARPLYERALAIREKALGPEHPSTASSLNNLAVLLRKTGERIEAELLFLRAIAIGEKVLGPEHPRTQRYRSGYARLLLETERSAEALTHSEAALATHAAINGPKHSWTKDSARITADALEALGRADEAVALRTRYGLDFPAAKAN